MAKRVYEITTGKLIAILAGMIVVGVTIPTGVWATSGSNVNLSDRASTTAGGDARITKNKLGVAACDVGTTGATTSNCARVVNGGLKVVDGAGALTVDGAVRDAAPATPFTGHCTSSFGGGAVTSCTIALPAGKSMVIETVSLTAATPWGEDIYQSDLELAPAGAGQADQTYDMAVPYRGKNGDGTVAYFATTESLRLYAPAGEPVVAHMGRNANG